MCPEEAMFLCVGQRVHGRGHVMPGGALPIWDMLSEFSGIFVSECGAVEQSSRAERHPNELCLHAPLLRHKGERRDVCITGS